MNIVHIPLDQIAVGERLRAVNPDYVSLIAASMAEGGQQTPIEVRENKGEPMYVLVAGAHRLAALREAGIELAAAVVFRGTALQARLREIDENLVRRELSVLDRATFLAERKAVYEEMHPGTRHGAAPAGGKSQDFATRFTADAADRLGWSERAVQLAISRHARLHAGVRAAIAHTWLADHGAQLDALARARPSEQMRAVRLLFGDVDDGAMRPRSVGDALAAVRGQAAPPPPDPDALAFAALARRWPKSAAFRRRVRSFVLNAKEKE